MINKIKAYYSYWLIIITLIAFSYIIYFLFSLIFSNDIFENLIRNIKKVIYYIYKFLMGYHSSIDDWSLRFWYWLLIIVFLFFSSKYIFKETLKISWKILMIPLNSLINFRRTKILINKTLEFNYYYTTKKDFYSIYKNNIEFLSYLIFNIKEVPIKWEKKTFFKTNYQNRNKLNELNISIKKIDNNSYVSELYSYGSYIDFEVSTTNNIEIFFNQLKKKENLEKLNFHLHKNQIEFDIINNHVRIKVIPKESLKTITLDDISKYSIDNKVLNLWFYQDYNNWESIIVDYKLKYSDLIHSFIVWATRHGKDILMLNITISILKNISKYDNSILHFFDTKWSDWKYLDWLELYWIFRHKNKDKFDLLLDEISKEIDSRQSKLWSFANIQKYNENNSDKMKDIFLIINEFLDISTFSNSNQIYSKIISLLSKWASVGLHVILMSQTIRKDTHKLMWSVLVNIWNYFALKVNSKDEKDIVWKWLSSNERANLDNQIKYNCLNISDNKIQKEFRAYLIEQETIRKWIEENFKIENIFEDKKINSYYNYVIKNKSFIRKEAFENFNLNQKQWELIKSKLIEINLIEDIPWKGYIFKE